MRFFVALLCCGLAGMSGCASETCPQAPVAKVHGLFDLAPGGVFPFPSNRFTRSDAESPSGFRLHLEPELTPVLDGALTLIGDDPGAQLEQINRLDGFALRGPMLLPFDGLLEPSSLPADSAASVEMDSSVFLVGLFGSGPDEGRRVPIDLRLLDWAKGQIIEVTPLRGLRPQARYALVATRDLLDAAGDPVGPSLDFWIACADCPPSAAWSTDDQRLARRLEIQDLLAQEAGLESADLVLVSVFTTQEIESRLAGLWEALESRSDFSVNLDWNGDGQTDLFLPADLPDIPPNVLGLEHVYRVLKGSFLMPEFRDEAGHMHFGLDGLPLVVDEVRVPFVLALPPPAMQPAPVVILQPGLSAFKEYAMFMAGMLAEQGLATLAIDLAEHGEGPSRDTAFVDLVDSEVTSANFYQSAADLGGLLRTLHGELAGLDVLPDGGDGQVDLDVTRVAFVGSSAGAMVGSLLLSRRPDIDAAAFCVGGGGFHNFLSFYFDGMLNAVKLAGLRALAQALTDKADPANHARAFSETAWPELPFLSQQVIGDSIMPAKATEVLARELGLPLLEPVLSPVMGLELAETPARGRGLFQFAEAKHGFLLAQDSYPESSERARRQIVEFLCSCWAAPDGIGQIIEP